MKTLHITGRILIITGAVLIIAALSCCWVCVKGKVGPNMEDIGEVKAKAVVNRIINSTINENFREFDDLENLLIVKTDKQGNICMVQSDTRKINSLMSALMLRLQDSYSKLPPSEIRVSAGTLLGSRILSQRGPYFNIKIVPLSVSETQFKTELEEQGINQTKYKIYAVIKSSIKMLAPFTDREITVTNTVLVAETVILGKVPDSYVVVPEESILDAVE